MQGDDFSKVKIKILLVLWYTFTRYNYFLNFYTIKMAKYSSNDDQRNKGLTRINSVPHKYNNSQNSASHFS